MGVAISNWKLAKAVSESGELGVVSGTGIGVVMISRLMNGDIGGHVRRALGAFPFQEPVRRLLKRYFIPEAPTTPVTYKRPAMWTLEPAASLQELTTMANFAEVFLAKEGHSNPVGINLLEKVQLPILSSIYGAMLAGVDYLLIGAGVPWQIPSVLDGLEHHESVRYRLEVRNVSREDDFRVCFDPRRLFPSIPEGYPRLKRPRFLPIVSSVVLAKSLIRQAKKKIDGFVVETSVAGGHNAPPRGREGTNGNGEVRYGEKDVVDLEKIKELGLPFWVAGGYDDPEEIQRAMEAGATGVQVGTAFAYCEESGMRSDLKDSVLRKVIAEGVEVQTSSRVSPTGFPFKVVQVENTISDSKTYAERERLCDLGMLRQAYKREDGEVGFRCASAPEKQFLAQGGKSEETIGRTCLCNNLLATAGYPQQRKDGYVEPPLLTAGDGLQGLRKFMKPDELNYTAKDVLDYLKG
ncbi:MAG: nitronate monooxygenase [Candidatus Eisenbacteria bacterium]|uniref:Nitronate monooxygenase n=1 Tax=Eiseniibacteriota bacterium TaxID=2212470 RepID=A0A7Y2H2H3_UNCEI|nr:nitronate monooxygenase [Candidatus Eisenbacteria bacterium]